MHKDPEPLASIRIRVTCGDEIAMGQGKADLLEAIETAGSIAAAGRSLGISYRKAWLMVDEMNRCFRQPVVEALKGGLRGGGTRVTETGHEALRRYRAIQLLARDAIAAELLEFRSMLSDKPRQA